MSFVTKPWCHMQLWCLTHPNALTRLCLTVCYSVDVLIYTIGGTRKFLFGRAELMGRNYASLGRLIVGDYDTVAVLLKKPQKRGFYLGRGRLVAKRMAKGFLLALSDKAAGGDGQHELFREFSWKNYLEPGWARADDATTQGYIDDFVKTVSAVSKTPTQAQMTPAGQRFVIRYMCWVLLMQEADDDMVEIMRTLFYDKSPFTSYLATRIKPTALPGFLIGKMKRLTAKAQEFVAASPAFADFVDGPDKMSRDEYAGTFLSQMGVAAFGGPFNLLINLMTRVPAEAPIDLVDDASLKTAVFEAGRVYAPVNNVNMLLTEPHNIMVGGESVTFGEGTVIAASIGLASLDPKQFPNPLKFKMDRKSLATRILNFNGVGFNPSYDALRVCPGRDIGLAMATSVLAAWRVAQAA